jgi:hypothetical protein
MLNQCIGGRSEIKSTREEGDHFKDVEHGIANGKLDSISRSLSKDAASSRVKFRPFKTPVLRTSPDISLRIRVRRSRSNFHLSGWNVVPT